MKRGVLIVKPDFFDDKSNYYLLTNILENNGLCNYSAYKIDNYSEFCKAYRRHDIAYTYGQDSLLYFEEIRKTSYATEAYEIKYPKPCNYGAALVFENVGLNDDVLYKLLFDVKQKYRSENARHRKCNTYIVLSDNPHTLMEKTESEMRQIEDETNLDSRD